MIRYDLKCTDGHAFDSWFQSAAAFDRLRSAQMVACPVCGTHSVDKSLMAPAVTASRKRAATPGSPVERPLSEPQGDAGRAMAALRREVEENSDYVGLSFASEARAIHAGEAPDRAIYGEARLDDARSLLADGIRVAPLPFMPPRRTN